MSRIASSNTKPEKDVRSALHEMGYRFGLNRKELPGKPDIVIPKFKTVIFVHGCFWHRHIDCPNTAIPKTRTEFWQAKFRATVERDMKKNQELKAAGWRVIVVWECELKKDSQAVLHKICEELIGGQHVT